MIKEQKQKIIFEVAEYFPDRIKSLIIGLKENVLKDICEIRLRIGRPLSLTVKGENMFISENGNICHLFQHGLLTLTESEMNEIFINMCDRSVYTKEEQIKRGFITIKNGCRVGIAASAVYENGCVTSFTNISSLNIRIATEVVGCALPIVNLLGEGLLIAGPPLSGKTTVLRDAVRLISNGLGTSRRRVAVVDTRGEIAGVTNGVPSVDLGALCDVISLSEKAKGIESAIRTLSPEVIMFDEIGNTDEAKAVLEGFNAGVQPICTVHIGRIEDILKREVSKMLLLSGAIKNVAFFKAVGEAPKIYSVSDLMKNYEELSFA